MFRFALYLTVYAAIFCTKGLALQVTNPFKPGSTVVNIDGNVRTLTRSTSCKAKYWGNSQENACTCCIVKQGVQVANKTAYERLKYFRSNAKKIVSHCLEKKHCTEDTLTTIAQSLDTSYDSQNLDLLVRKIFGDAQVVAGVGKIGEDYHQEGALTPQGVIFALSNLARQKKIPSTPQEIRNCFKAEVLSEKGSQSAQLFTVSQNTYCNNPLQDGKKLFNGVYVVKELRKGKTEIKNTARVKESFLNQYNLTNPNRPKGFPAIALDEISLTYKDQAGKPHYLAILTLAPGSSVFTVLKNFAESYKTHKEDNTLSSLSDYKVRLTKARHTMASLGAQIGRLHATHMTRDKRGRFSGKSTAVHGDMHSNNIFVDDPLNVVLIDPETFAIGLDSPRSVGKDLLRIYLFSTLRNAAHQNARKGNVDQGYWHEQIIKPFLLEYILSYAYLDGTYNEENFKDVIRILKSTFSLSGSGRDPEAVFIHTGIFKSMMAYRKYITPLLKEIEKEIRESSNPIELSLQGSPIQAKRVKGIKIGGI